jgi:nucleoside-diphosphate-sugar epimerase
VLPPPDGLQGPDVEVVQADMRDAAAVRDAARGVEVVYHLAAGQRMKPQRRVVHVSSSGVYGIPRSTPVTEAHPQRPLGAYGRSKIEAEALCLAFVARGGDAAILRPMSLFGPNMSGVFLILFDWVHRGKNVYLLGAGRNTVQMVSAWDVADACVRAADAPGARGAVFNLGAEANATVRGQVEALIAHARSRSRIVALPAGALRAAARALGVVGLSPIVPEHYLLADTTFILDTTRARSMLGWTPRFDNVTLMTDAYDWYAANVAHAAPRRGPILALLDAFS